MDSEEHSEWNLSQVGFKARSPEGHAARAMHIKGDEYVWVEIQEKTFKNWVNEQIRPLNMSISNFQTDFNDGLKLIALIEVLQKRKLKKIKKPLNQHQCLENVQIALQAMASDNIKLVNIGNTDIVEGNLKLILGLIWSLILRYQIGRTNFPPKKLMLSWLQAVLPDLHITNFTSDWNSGIALSALLEYCKPGLVPNWKSLTIKNSVENCRKAMHIARDEFAVPMILTPEDLASHNLDELSGMTYLSYFMRDDSPGYKATLSWVQKQLPQFSIKNFTTDWNDGLALCALVSAYGANIPDYKDLKKEKTFWEQNIQHGILGGESLGVRPILKPKELSDPEVEHLGVMAYIARFQWIKPRVKLQDRITVMGVNLNNVHVNKPAHFNLIIHDNTIDEKKIWSEVRFQNKKADCQLSVAKNGGAGSFIPTEVGMYELYVCYENEIVTGSPLLIKVYPALSGIDPCALGFVIEVLINSNGDSSGNVFVEALSPSEKLKNCSVIENNGVYTATFTPDEVGEWKIIVSHAGKHINESLFTCSVYDPSSVKVQGIGPVLKNAEKTLIIDASTAGCGEMKIELLHNSTPVPLTIDQQGNGIYKVTFCAKEIGKHHLNVTFNSLYVKGSPFYFRVVENEKELKDVESSSLDKIKKDQFSSMKETLLKNHFSSENLNSVHAKSSEYVNSSKYSENKANSNVNNYAKTEFTNQSVRASEMSNDKSSVTNRENLSFSQRAEIVNNKLMANKEDFRWNKTAAPPTPKKPAATEAFTNSYTTKEKENSVESLKSSNYSSEQHTVSDSSHTLFEKNDSLGAKPKVFPKKLKENAVPDASFNQYKSKFNSGDFPSFSSPKYRKEITDISEVVAEGEGLKLVHVKQPTTFSVYAPWLKQDDIQVVVTAPSGREIPFRFEQMSHGRYQVEYITAEVGEHTIEISVAGKPLIGSPFHCFAYDPHQIKVGKIPNGTVGKPVEFEINGADAGSGNLEILVNGGCVTSNVKSLGNDCFLASFIPHTATIHTIEMKFNGHPVPGSIWECEVTPSNKISINADALKSFSVKQPAVFEIVAEGYRKEDLKISIIGPSKTSIRPRISEIASGIYHVEFNAYEVGNYSVDVFVDGRHVPGCPFLAQAYSSALIRMLDVAPTCLVGSTYQFQVDASQAGKGPLKISVNDGLVPNQVGVLGNEHCLVSFRPETPGIYTIDIKFNGENIPGCPFSIEAIDSPRLLEVSSPELVPINKTAHFSINIKDSREGELKISVISPSGVKVPVKIYADSKLGFIGEFVPKEPGSYILSIDYGKDEKFPYTIKAFDPQLAKDSKNIGNYESRKFDLSKMKVHGNGIECVPVNSPTSFTVDCGDIDYGEIHCTILGPTQMPLKYHLIGNHKNGYKIEYTPTETGDHVVDVRISGEPVPGSPYLVKVYDASKVTPNSSDCGKSGYFNNTSLHGKSSDSKSVVTVSTLRMTSLSQGAHFTVDTRGLESGELKVIVNGPTKKPVPVKVNKTSSSTFDVSFSPQDTGLHEVFVTLDDVHLAGSPFICNVYDASKVKVMKLAPGFVGKPCTFRVDASKAGEGKLELVVHCSSTESSVRAEVSMRSNGLYDVTFIPQEKIPHYVDITFNNEDVPGSPFKIEIHGQPSKGHNSVVASGEGLKQGLVGSMYVFDIETSEISGDIDVRVTDPNGSIVPATVINMKHGIHKVEYQPFEIGTYRVEVLHNGNTISAKPFLVEICDPSRVKVVDVEDGIIGREQVFKVDVSRAGRGTLNVIISAAGREVKFDMKEISSGIYEVVYIPRTDHSHKIDVFYNGHQAPGCPQIVEIHDPSQSIIAHGSGLKSCPCGKTSSFFIETGGFAEAKGFDIIVVSPHGSPLPVKCYQQKDGSLLAEWPAQQAGNHKIEVLYAGKPITGSPFSCQVFDATKVALQKIKTTTFAVGEEISFTLNRKDAGYAELDVTVTSPLGRHLPIEVKGTADGEGELIEFIPTVPGKYKIAITYGGIEVPGSPVTFIAQENGVPKVEGEGLTVAQVGTNSSFKIFAKGLWGHPRVVINGPETEAEVNVAEHEDGIFTVTYLPLEIGLFDVKIFWNNKEIPSSPYHPRVVNTNKMRVIGGLENLVDEQNHIPLTVGEERRIPFDVSDAGPGKPRAEVKGPSGVLPSKFEQTGNYRYHLLFTPKEKGEHQIYVYFSEMPLPVSPLLAYAEEVGPIPDHTRVVLRGHGLTGAKVGEEAEFIIDGSEAGPGSPEVTISGMKADITVQISPIGNNVYKVLYTPTILGAYLLNVMWSDRQVKGCPLKVNVIASCDSQKVLCSGDGLRGGTVGKEIKAFIDTRKAGPGELTAHCMGPHKVAYCELYDHRDGTFTLYLKPQEGGRHVLTIKYGGEHVPGSPFTIRIAGAPDASKVRVYGPGIEPGVLATYQSRFICDTRGAGAGQLTVRIRGPKGAFRVEMQRESQKDRTILCKYDPTEPGDYRLEVKWSGEHVPGSPFMVMIFDTQEELNHYLQGQYQSSSGGPPMADYFGGSLTYSTDYRQMSWRGSTAEL